MRVIHVLDHSLPRQTAYALRTIAMLEEQRALGWETFHLTGPRHACGACTEEEVDGWHFYRTPAPGGILEGVPGLGTIELMGEIAYRIEQIARRVRPHILHAHSPIVNAIPALRVGRRLRIPVVYEVRPLGDDTAGTESLPASRLRHHLVRSVETWVLKRADAITTVCEAMRGDIVVRGIPAEKVTVIPSAPEVAAPESRPARESAEANDNTNTGSAWLACGTRYRDVYAELMGAV